MTSLRARFLIVLILSAVFVCAPASAQITSSYVGALALPSVSSPPSLQGGLKDAVWKRGASVSLAYDLRTQKDAAQAPVVHALISRGKLYVAFDVPQDGPTVADHQQNDAGLGTDDAVIVYLYPDGTSGYTYSFAVNPRGIHAASSSENSTYSPTWESFGAATDHGYVVTMSIPLAAIKGGKNGTWRANFRRYESRTLEDDIWSYGPSAVAGSDPPPSVAGSLSGFPSRALAYPRSRFGVYGLGEIASSTLGGNTSRVGVDASVPITRTTSFVLTLHPDYSNVEADQQTIAPTAFPRYFNEVRPFFAQLSNSFNYAGSSGAIAVQPLYSYLIPTPRYGSAIEGKQGPFSIAAFDAVGDGRDDNGQSVAYISRDQRITLSAQRQMTSVPGLTDMLDTFGGNYDSQKGLAFNLTQANESNAFITDPTEGHWQNAGLSFYDKVQSLGFAWEKVGSQFSPADAYVQNSDVAGWSGQYNRTWYLTQNAHIPRVLLYAESDLYHNSVGQLAQSDNQLAFGADLKSILGLRQIIHVRVGTGSSYLLMPDGQLVAASQNGVDLTYGYRTATPQLLSYYTGRFGPGTLDYWIRQVNFRVARTWTLQIEDDDGDQRLDDGIRNKQWLLKGGLVWQASPSRSLTIGARRISGSSPLLEEPSGYVPSPIDQWNLSAAFYQRWPNMELYAAYGDPSRLSTAPGFIIKLIRYFGAEKGV